ncbi:hypothetical protein KAFR_0H00310 [Kazachstania africana CBS 2517]|uniref:Pre-mRNA-splicing factor ATP-dependent RNA helicase PRP16 n=1 Tax=Kazachstania africana (strain ATCC 22294 / BCRC 22015 / CBS 2517 / CECT 1963 / NBRC 1671 / NRRL Y-8276) TaxID=1071382 RepID=H2AYN4_KAZAF|nr:hypothetical protein KAFR_0H00310 [Kazachstania africana CBS 2517]CCF59440.1 hypothetical protein KAFR_0H00310 [Kazachstania africana CBS 2517]
MSKEQDLIDCVQKHTSSNVTPNFLDTLRRISAKNSTNVQGFIDSSKALGKFEGEESFLAELHCKLLNNETTSTGSKVAAKKRKVRLSYMNEGDDEEDDDGNEDFIVNPFLTKESPKVKSTSQIKFKKLDRGDAQRLKEYASPSVSSKVIPKPSTKNDQTSILNRFIPGRPKMGRNDTISETDREWYNYDDDYGNPVPQEESFISELQFKRPHLTSDIDVSNIHTQVQVDSLSINERKEWIPQFLKVYTQERNISDSTILGSLAEQNAQDGLINPFKKPDGQFAINARKGSKLVNFKRISKEQRAKAKESTAVAGTQLGNLLGLKESHEKREEDTTQHTTFENTPEDIESTRRSLPAFKVRSDLLTMIRDNQISIIIGETGSGKTTQLAQYLYEDGFCSGGRLIGITQPRRVAAMSVANRVALEMNVQLGEEVGYSIRFEDYTSPKTRLKFMTDGILLRETLLDPELEKYGCIIIDEAHERSLNTDIMIGILRNLLVKRRDLKLIVTSATMNAAKFSEFFGNAPQFTIPGRTYPVDIIYSKNLVNDYVEAAVTEAVKIHLSNKISSGDILIFMTGQEDIEVCMDLIKEKLTEVYSKKFGISKFEEISDLEIFPLYSALPPALQNKIFRKLDDSRRKIVIATNIAETSLTIDGIRYVVDCGYSKLKVYNPRIGLDSLAITPISRANANQRSGRAGRTSTGVAYRLYTEETLETEMYVSTIPELQRTSLQNTILLLKSLGVKDVLSFPLMDSPPLQTLLASLYDLWLINAIDNFGNLTSLGKLMSKFPLQPSLARILITASYNDCSEEMLTIVSMLSVPQVFQRPKQREKEADLARSKFFVPGSDHLTLLNVYSQWKQNKFSSQWCTKNFVQYRAMCKAHDIREQLVKIMGKNKVLLTSSGTDWTIVKKCICSGFAHQAAKLSGLGKYVHMKTGMDVQLHPTSTLFGLGDPPSYVVYNELLMTSKEYICCVTAVDPFWLVESGPLLYGIRRIDDDSSYHQSFALMQHKTGNDHAREKRQRDDIEREINRCLEKRTQMIIQLQQDNKKAESLLKREHLDRTKLDGTGSFRIGLKKGDLPEYWWVYVFNTYD